MRERNRTTDSVRFKDQVITVVEKCKALWFSMYENGGIE